MPMLQTRQLGRKGPRVPAIGLGLMGLSGFYGKSLPENERLAFLSAAYETGEVFWDTADMYGDSEDLLGKWFQANAGKRDNVFLATKFGQRFSSNHELIIDSSPNYVRMACEKSLSRLGVSKIDLYYCHRLDRKTPIERTVEAMVELKKEGKIDFLGLSECSAESLRRAHKLHPITAIQMEYSPFATEIEEPKYNILSTARELGVAVVAYAPLGRGFLTGILRSPEEFSASDIRTFAPRFSEENFKHNCELAKNITVLAEKKKVTPAQLILAWLMAQGHDVFPIPGTTSIERLGENLRSLEITITRDEEQSVRSACAGVAGGRYPASMSAALFADTPGL